MAILTNVELQNIRNGFASKINPLPYNRTLLNAAAQAIETRIANSLNIISSDIDTATSPTVLTVAEKKELIALVLHTKYLRDF